MKKYIIFILLLQFSLLANSQNVGLTKCSNLFISELYFGKSLDTTDNLYDLNYAVEIFNPTSLPIGLSNYSLVLTNSLNNSISISLYDSIQPGEVYVVCNSNADLNLQQMAEQLNAGLDFENYITLDLMHNSTVIDRVGETVSSPSTPFDIIAFLQDPSGYLASQNLHLDEFQNIDIRRGMFVNIGEPNFTSQGILGNWSFNFNTDRSNIGQHYCVCNEVPESGPIIGYVDLSYTVFQNHFCPYIDPLNIQYSFFPTGINTDYQHNVITGNATWDIAFPNGDIYLDGAPSYYSQSYANCYEFNGSYCTGARTTSYQANTKFANVKLNAISNVTIDPARELHHIDIIGLNFADDGCGILGTPQIANINDISVYPTFTENIINIRSKGKYQYQIYSVDGKLLKNGSIRNDLSMIEIGELLPATYIIKFTNSKKNSFYTKVSKI